MKLAMESLKFLTFLGCILTFSLADDSSEEVFNDYIQRPNLVKCAENAVCGDIFFQRRLMKDGTRRPENRHIVNCICDGSESCNFGPEHEIYQSSTHREALCKPISEYKLCRPGQTPKNLRMGSTNMGNKNYLEVKCLCHRHFRPVEGRGSSSKATIESYPTRFDPTDYAEVRPYRCQGNDDDLLRELNNADIF